MQTLGTNMHKTRHQLLHLTCIDSTHTRQTCVLVDMYVKHAAFLAASARHAKQALHHVRIAACRKSQGWQENVIDTCFSARARFGTKGTQLVDMRFQDHRYEDAPARGWLANRSPPFSTTC